MYVCPGRAPGPLPRGRCLAAVGSWVVPRCQLTVPPCRTAGLRAVPYGLALDLGGGPSMISATSPRARCCSTLPSTPHRRHNPKRYGGEHSGTGAVPAGSSWLRSPTRPWQLQNPLLDKGVSFGADDRIRTGDPHLGKVMLDPAVAKRTTRSAGSSTSSSRRQAQFPGQSGPLGRSVPLRTVKSWPDAPQVASKAAAKRTRPARPSAPTTSATVIGGCCRSLDMPATTSRTAPGSAVRRSTK